MTGSDDLLLHMRRVQSAERDLRDLGVVWQMIESSAAISCPEEMAGILPTLVRTRERFGDLQERLIERMVAENQAALGDELAAKAQCAIDILVRNLYERTADVGFLATDAVVRDFCAAGAAERDGRRGAMVQRLREYQAKYSVYDDVVLLAPGGEILARLDGSAALAASNDPIVAEALASGAYVERFRCSDLAEGGAAALLYAHRITTPEGRAIGTLVLRFRFADEMQRIFRGVADERHQIALMLIDDERRVVLSNDEAHVPSGARLRAIDPGEVALTAFAGREYLAVVRATSGYQGYPGPGWRVQAMVSLLTAFRQRDEDFPGSDDVALDNNDLATIHADAEQINRDLRRVVWNGRLAAGQRALDRAAAPGREEHTDGQARLKAVLGQVATAGTRTRERVDRAIRELYRTALARSQHQAAELARLAADIMDRNLYERANDCRWWALSPAVQQALAAGPEADPQALNAVLDHINGLYTVYSRLVVFDAAGVIRGASRDSADGQTCVGRSVDARWCQATEGLAGSQQYAVSPYEDTPLHGQGATYVYLAAVRDPEQGQRHLGGVAIVFNAAAELAAILGGVIGPRAGLAAFVDATGQVLAASDPTLAPALTAALGGGGGVFEHDGVHYAGSRIRAQGYREFKSGDGYDNGVSAVVALRLGADDRRHGHFSDAPLAAATVRQRQRALEVAIFQVGAMRYALPAAALTEALAPRGLVRTPDGGGGPMVGLMDVPSGGGPRLVQVACGRRLFGVAYPARVSDGVVLVLRSPQSPERAALGLRVDDVLTVVEVDRDGLHPAPGGFEAFAPWVSGLIDCEAQGPAGPQPVLVQLLDPLKIIERLVPAAMSVPEASFAEG